MRQKSTILYIEDNRENRILIRRVLTAEGYEMIEASGAVEAMQVINNQRPDLILMDVNMPETDGYTLTAQICQDTDHCSHRECDARRPRKIVESRMRRLHPKTNRHRYSHQTA